MCKSRLCNASTSGYCSPGVSLAFATVGEVHAPYRLTYAVIIVFCAIGVISINNTGCGVFMMAFVGLAGYVFSKL